MDFSAFQQQAKQTQQIQQPAINPILFWIDEYKSNKKIRQSLHLPNFIEFKLELENLILREKEFELKILEYQERNKEENGK